MADSVIPKRLYKYQAFSTQALANLVNRQIWFSRPARFNDPFDCALKVCSSGLSDAELGRLYSRYRVQLPESNDWDQRYLTDGQPNQRFREDIERGLEGGFSDTGRDIRERGIACFAEHLDDLLMWAHYADGHRGLCLEFDTSFDPFPQAKRVTYRSQLVSVDVPSLLNAPQRSNILDALVLTKSKHWAYEREWRLLHKEGDCLVPFDCKALTGIYLGAAMPEGQKHIICLVLHGSPTRLHQMMRKDDAFTLISGEVTYRPVPYADKGAKAQLETAAQEDVSGSSLSR